VTPVFLCAGFSPVTKKRASINKPGKPLSQVLPVHTRLTAAATRRIVSTMQKFPDPVIVAMHHAGTTVTCMPVQYDEAGVAVAPSTTSSSSASNQGGSVDAGWESAIFFVLPLSVADRELKSLFPATGLFPVGLEADLIEHESGTLIELGIEIDLGLAEKPSGIVLFLTGHLPSHFEAVQLLSKQESIGLFIGDVHCNLLHQQRIPLADGHRSAFDSMLQDSIRRDALIRMTGHYDPEAVFDSVAQKT